MNPQASRREPDQTGPVQTVPDEVLVFWLSWRRIYWSQSALTHPGCRRRLFLPAAFNNLLIYSQRLRTAGGAPPVHQQLMVSHAPSSIRSHDALRWTAGGAASLRSADSGSGSG